MMNVTIIRASDEHKLLWSALDVVVSQVVANRPIKTPLLGEGSVGSNLDTVKPSHSVPGYINRWDVYVKVSFFLFFFFWSGLQGPNAYSLWYGVVPKPSIGEGYL